MDLTPYLDSLRRDLMAAAEASGPETRQAAERLAFALDPAARLALMEAISQATAEITAEMPTGGVDVRLTGRDLDFVVQGGAPPVPEAPAPAPPSSEESDEDGAVARITLRMPESVKLRAEEMAAAAGHSLNTWLVNVVRSATRDGAAVKVDVDLSSIPFLGTDPFGGRPPGRAGRRMTGWV
jgi:hypothetical protein